MAPSRRLSNGATPTAAKQRSITSFFSAGSNAVTRTPSPSPSPKPSLVIPSPLQTTSPEPSSSLRTPPPSKPSSVEPSPSSSRHGEGVVGWRIRVFWPLDDQWYEGHVKSFNASTGKHLIQYDDGEEEALDLEKERFQWAEVTPLRSFRRLRRISSGDGSYNGDSLAKRIEDEISEEGKEEGGGGDGDNSEDEDWDKDGSGEDEGGDSVKGSKGGSAGSRKRKNAGSIRSGSDSSVTQKKSVRVVGLKDEGKRLRFDVGEVSPREKEKGDIAGLRGSTVYGIETAPVRDVAERFGRREMEKFEFLGKGRRDANGRKPGDEYYDPRTLKLPNDFLKSLSAGQRQWWQFKSKHMDKVLFFKMGKFYELFEMDAHIAFKELDLQYMKGEQPHCGFPERNFAMNVEKLAMKGYRVLVVEQTETPDQLELRRKEMGSKDKVVKREICAVITKGTLVESEMLSTNADVSYLMSVTESCKPTEGGKDDTVTLGICIADVSTSKFMLGQFEDREGRPILRSILTELRPAELIKPSKMLSRETEKVLLDNTRNPLVNNLIPDIEFWDAHRTLFEARRVYELSTLSRSLSESKVDISSTFDVVDEDTDLLPKVLTELENAAESGQYALSAFGGCLFYLRQALLDTSLLRCARFEFLPCPGFLDISKKSYMTLDASALENLEIFENNSGSSSGTLFAQLDYCVTPFGKRLLKNWLARPLCDAKSILERQHAITDLKHVAFDSVLEFRKMLSKVPDMERLLARLFANSEASGRNATKVVLYEDAAKKQLHEFITALRGCQMMVHSCALFSNIQDDLTSTTLQCLLTGDCFLDIEPVLMHFKDAFDWTEAEHTGRIIPHEGVDVEYDSSCKAAAEIETNLIRYLKEQRKLLGDSSVAYVTVGKDRYVLEVPEDLQGRIPTEYQLHSSKKGYFRYWTPQIRAHLGELSNAEAERESKLKSILQRFIIRFCDHHLKLRQLISVIAELDALSSLAVASDYYEGPVCRPTILGSSCSKGTPSLSGKCLGHPILKSDAMGKGSFVPNDVNIGGTNNASFVLLTGPNMGGKSTLLRQVCLAVILAQIGAYVPGESFELSPVDRIFVRMGAKDHIMAGQSTFLTELSETATMLLSATHNSLVALDELGRGTSTSDGQAIAESVLDHFIQKIGCRGMFSTHYHRLAVKYENDSQVGLFHMACQVEKRVDGIEEVTFLYKLTPGACPRSYGVNVACLAGIPESVLKRAALKSSEFEAAHGKHRNKSGGLLKLENEDVAVLRDLLKVIVRMGQQDVQLCKDAGCLHAYQERARLLLSRFLQ